MTQSFNADISTTGSAAKLANGLQPAVQPDATQTAFPQVNTITLAGQVMPGKWTLLDGPRVFRFDIREAYALSYAVLVPLGNKLLHCKFRVDIWKQSDFAIFREVRKTLLSNAVVTVGGTRTSKALGIDHPELKALGVMSVVIEEVTPMICDETGLWSCKVSFIQWAKGIPAPKKADTTIPDAPPPQPTATDAAQVEIERLRKERAGLAGP